MRRTFLFLTINIAVLVVVRIILTVLGINGTDQVDNLLVCSVVVGFSGSIISLLTSKTAAKNSVGAGIIIMSRDKEEARLLGTVAAQAYQWDLKTPEVAIYHSPESNTFTTGASKNNSLAAVNTGLLDHMHRDEMEAVLAHEVAYVDNGGMVTLTLIQGAVNTSIVFLARIVSSMVARNSDGNSSQGAHFLVGMVLQIILGFLASIIAIWFSRQREYHANAGAAKLVGAPKVVTALQRLRGGPSDLPQEMNAMSVTSDTHDSLLSTHPSLDDRVARLKAL